MLNSLPILTRKVLQGWRARTRRLLGRGQNMNKEYEFSKLNPIQDGVLVCTKNKETSKHSNMFHLSQIKFKDGVTLGSFLEGIIGIINKQGKEIEELKKVVGLSVDYQLAQAAEGAANEKDSIN